jgi:phosphoribosylamine--glycine ligase
MADDPDRSFFSESGGIPTHFIQNHGSQKDAAGKERDMNILVIGGGGREHCLAWKLGQSSRVSRIYCAPGNGGISRDAACVPIKADDINNLARFAVEKEIDFTVVGPEAPLVEGISDAFIGRGLRVFGPTRLAAELEGSKIFAKEFMIRYGIPTADYEICDTKDRAVDVINSMKFGFPLVIKAEGLAAGKGVMIVRNRKEAYEAVDRIMVQKEFGAAGDRILLEAFLEGEEASFMVLSDGYDYLPLAPSKDHKSIFEDGRGPNTGGMGAYSPSTLVDEKMAARITEEVIKPTIEGMRKEDREYCGVLYAGLMITEKGPQVLEFNVRFGDPETQVVLPRLNDDLLDLMEACVGGDLKGHQGSWTSDICLAVILASAGYPGKYEKGIKIKGLRELEKKEDMLLFHAGTTLGEGGYRTAGGRVVSVGTLAPDYERAMGRVYRAIKTVSFEGMQYRKDIGKKALQVVNKPKTD